MKLLLGALGYFTLFLTRGHAMILLTSFDPFSGGSANNSYTVASGVLRNLNNEINISHCLLSTSYDKAAEKIIDCINELPEQPKLVISLGEGNCSKIRLETRAHNFDNGIGPDNSGVTKEGVAIIPGAPDMLGLNIDWSEAFCSLSRNQKAMTWASSHAGVFVCNNTMYHMSHSHGHIPYGFIHVPAHTCSPRKQKISESIKIVTHLIRELDKQDTQLFTPYGTSWSEIQNKRTISESYCEKDFLRRLLTTY